MPRSHPTPPTPPTPPLSWRRYVRFGAPVFVAGALFLWLAWPALQVTYWVHGLNADDPRTRAENLENLRRHPDRARVEAALRRTLSNADQPFVVRRTCAAELLRAERIGDLERVLESGTLAARTAALDVLAGEPYFRSVYVGVPRWNVTGTLTQWLDQPQDASRVYAVQIARNHRLEELLPRLIALFDALAQPSGPRPLSDRKTMVVLVGAVRDFGHCDRVPQLLRLAQEDPDAIVRLRAMQAAFNVVAQTHVCPGAVTEEALRNLVAERLEDADKATRMGAALILQERTDWVPGLEPRLRAVLESDRTPEERRGSLELLVAVKDEAILARLPAYFHDSQEVMRSSASSSVAALAPENKEKYLACFIGLLRDERESELGFRTAVNTLNEAAGEVLDGFLARPGTGAPQETRAQTWQRLVGMLFAAGEAAGAPREEWAEAYFRWFCTHLGLDPKTTERALEARSAFWTEARASDAAAARAVLERAPDLPPSLFSYEAGWLLANEGARS